jgi:regulator of sigma E protease
MPKAIGLFGAVFLFGFAVFIHEFGHFIVAKLCGVAVGKFAIGFGPKIWSKVFKDTEYSIRWIPFGGFVQLKGMMPDEEKKDDAVKDKKADPESITGDLDAMRSKPAWMRIAILAAGVSMNFISAIVFMAFMLWYGVPVPVDMSNKLETIPVGSQWHQLGWRGGDEIVGLAKPAVTGLGVFLGDEGTTGALFGHPVANWTDLHKGILEAYNKLGDAAKAQGAPRGDINPSSITLTAHVRRGAETLSLPLPLALMRDETEGAFFQPPSPAYVGAVVPGSAAFKTRLVKANYKIGETIRPFPTLDEMKSMPLKQGDYILEVDHQPVKTWNEMTALVRPKPNETVLLTVDRDGDILLLAAVLDHDSKEPDKGQLGIYFSPPLSGERDRLSPLQALSAAPLRTVLIAGRLVGATVHFFRTSSGRDIKRNLGGPIAIGVMAYQSAQRGLTDYLHLFIAISILLAVMNLLPIPVLDGGFIAIVLIETVIRRPVPQKVLVPILTFFWILLVILMVLISFNDVAIRVFQ